VLTSATRERLPAASGMRAMGRVALRGRDAAVDLYTIEQIAPTQKE
jgi:class 3 adenylate cyclase